MHCRLIVGLRGVRLGVEMYVSIIYDSFLMLCEVTDRVKSQAEGGNETGDGGEMASLRQDAENHALHQAVNEESLNVSIFFLLPLKINRACESNRTFLQLSNHIYWNIVVDKHARVQRKQKWHKKVKATDLSLIVASV